MRRAGAPRGCSRRGRGERDVRGFTVPDGVYQRRVARVRTPETADDRLARMASFAAAVAAAATKSEANKGAFVKAEVETCLVAILNEAEAAAEAASLEEEDPDALASRERAATREACSAIRALTTGDDPREPASGAFAHARALAKAGAATALCAALAREAEAGDAVDLRLAQQLAAATRHVAVNDDICRETAERGGLTTTLRLLRGPATGSARATKACAQLVRQLAGSDHVKGLILRHDGIAALAHCARVFAERAATAPPAPTPKANGDANFALPPAMRSLMESGSTPKSIREAFLKMSGQTSEDREEQTESPSSCLAATEQCVGALAAACLKNPEAATACASANVFEIVAEAMSSDVGVKHAGVQRQACMFFRNAVVRNPELRSVAGDDGGGESASGETDTRAVRRRRHRRAEDLGCDNYNEGYNPTTAVMGADGSCVHQRSWGTSRTWGRSAPSRGTDRKCRAWRSDFTRLFFARDAIGYRRFLLSRRVRRRYAFEREQKRKPLYTLFSSNSLFHKK